MAGRCRTTGLVSYSTKTRAEKAIEKNAQHTGGRAYRCGCNSWHIEGSLRGGEDRRQQPARWTGAEWDEATLQLWSRCRDFCEWCGKPLAGNLERHHRQRRAIGGDYLHNLVGLHTHCHQHVHANPREARARGFIVTSYDEHPELVPLTLHDSRVVQLSDDGHYLSA